MKDKCRYVKIFVALFILCLFISIPYPITSMNISQNYNKMLNNYNKYNKSYNEPLKSLNTSFNHEILTIKNNNLQSDIFFSSPLNNDIFRAGDTIEIVGTITGDKFKSYKVEYGIGINPSTGIQTVLH